MPTTSCAIWQTQAELLDKVGDFEVFDSPRAGGKYWISNSAVAEISTLTDHTKRLLTTWLCEQRRSGVETPRIRSNVLDLVKSRRSLTVTARLTAAIQFLGNATQTLGDSISYGESSPNDLLSLAETESQNTQEVCQLFIMLQSMGYIQGQIHFLGGSARLSAAGWHELEKLKQSQTDSSQAFVAMWFHEATDEAYFNGIAPALTASGYKPIRIDKKEHNNKIDDEIIAEIRRSRFLVADFTCEPKNIRGGVYYEAGFAQGLGVPVIWTCKETSIRDLHFDTRQYSRIVWKEPSDLFLSLRNRIGATIGDGPLPKS